MGYLHINNLYKDPRIMLFRQCYALEKIHGTSAHLYWKENHLVISSGGASSKEFNKLFDADLLEAKFAVAFPNKKVYIYGEAYGGKEQGMSLTYGKQLKFIVFDVQIDGLWLAVPEAEKIATEFGLEFVDYEIIETSFAELNRVREKPSTQAKRNGIEEDKMREGVVLRPLVEMRVNNDERLIAKHKNDIFKETKSSRELTDEQIAILGGAQEIADEWVTEMRLSHVLDKLHVPMEPASTTLVIKAMLEDIAREAAGEIKESPEARKAIGKKTATMFKDRCKGGGL